MQCILRTATCPKMVSLIAHAELFQETYIMSKENIKLHLLAVYLTDFFTERASDFVLVSSVVSTSLL